VDFENDTTLLVPSKQGHQDPDAFQTVTWGLASYCFRHCEPFHRIVLPRPVNLHSWIVASRLSYYTKLKELVLVYILDDEQGERSQESRKKQQRSSYEKKLSLLEPPGPEREHYKALARDQKEAFEKYAMNLPEGIRIGARPLLVTVKRVTRS
jgi:hypothetical protein